MGGGTNETTPAIRPAAHALLPAALDVAGESEAAADTLGPLPGAHAVRGIHACTSITRTPKIGSFAISVSCQSRPACRTAMSFVGAS